MSDWNALARTLRQLHAVLLRRARDDYMKEQGIADEISPGELLQLAIRNEAFAWLRRLSELMVEIDDVADDAATADDPALQAAMRATVERLLAPAAPGEEGNAFALRYWAHVHADPEVTMAHAAVRQALQSWPAAPGDRKDTLPGNGPIQDQAMNPDAPASLLVLPGSSRTGSFNLTLARAAGRIAQAQGAAVRLLDLRTLGLPLYDGDIEAAQGVPEQAGVLIDAIVAADAVLIVTPEYNGFPTPLVINAFDWLSRAPASGTRPTGLKATAGKPAGLLSASPGPLGGLRSMNYLRQYLQMAFAMIVHPRQFALSRAGQAFDAAGELQDEKAREAVSGVVGSLLELAVALRSRPK
jgi:chromate reductase, NAD(P)H dehydrogenase (quinone)